ncbi:MAG: hypothetical protein ABSA16_08800 [Thermoguttaceae bacterium]
MTTDLRLVFDTNVAISAMLLPLSIPGTAYIHSWLRSKFTDLLSLATIAPA